MPIVFKSSIICSTVVFICFCVGCGSFQSQPIKLNVSEVSRIENISFPYRPTNSESAFSNLDSIKTNIHPEDSLKNLTSRNTSFTRHYDKDLEVRNATVLSEKLEFALEGGDIGILSRNSSVKGEDGGVFEEEFHNKGSKGRKGVRFQGSSVVPRKGVGLSVAVEQIGDNPFSNSTTAAADNLAPFTNNLLVKNNTKTALNGKASFSSNYESTKPQVKVQLQQTPIGMNDTHSKKPEYVSDEKDVDDFEKYSIIKTSTTGEDYVIIGIVIVIGIWFSVFGALIFYRRAGEYWDRRHYRRMDFLVEGMYND